MGAAVSCESGGTFEGRRGAPSPAPPDEQVWGGSQAGSCRKTYSEDVFLHGPAGRLPTGPCRNTSSDDVVLHDSSFSDSYTLFILVSTLCVTVASFNNKFATPTQTYTIITSIHKLYNKYTKCGSPGRQNG